MYKFKGVVLQIQGWLAIQRGERRRKVESVCVCVCVCVRVCLLCLMTWGGDGSACSMSHLNDAERDEMMRRNRR